MGFDRTWIGLAHVRPRLGNDLLDGAIGAFVPVVALADDDQDFAATTASLLDSYGFDVVAVEDIELIDQRRQHSIVADDILELAIGLTPSNPIALSRFEAYESE